jgi:hypothetical protein
MSLIIATFPDDPAELPSWLEKQLIGLDLGRLVAELRALHGSEPGPSLTEILGAEAAVLDHGLRSLSQGRIALLLRHPDRLLELQEWILTQASLYWESVPRQAPLHEFVGALRDKLGIATAQSNELAQPARPSRRRRWRQAVALAAACLLAGFWLGHQIQSRRGADWGWAKPGGVGSKQDARTHLINLADRADEWFNRRPEDAAGVALRISEFRAGCTALLFADHAPLSESQRKDLTARCRNWAAKFDDFLRQLEAGNDPPAVRAEADETVHKLTKFLRSAAEEQ